MASPVQLAKNLAQDIKELDDLLDEALRPGVQRAELVKILRELPLQVRTIKMSLLAYVQDTNLSERIIL